MKRIFVVLALIIPMMISCGGNTESSKKSKDSIVVDSLLAYMKKIDSLRNNGQLFHVDIYELGKLGSIYFDVYNVSSGGESAQYLNLKKDCGGQYIYDWEDAILIKGEIKYLMAAVDTVLANFDRVCNHEERYVYVTKDDIRLFSTAWEERKWTASLSVDYRKKDSSVSLNKEDLDKLKKLLIQGEIKIDSLEQKNDTTINQKVSAKEM